MSANFTPSSNGVKSGERGFPCRVAVALALCLGASSLAARDVTQEQGAVQFARQAYEKADAQYQADKAQAERTAQALNALKKQYEAERKKAKIAEAARREAKSRLDAAEAALDRAWKQ